MIFPLASVAVVPETWMTFPTRTAREYPTMGSHCVPVEISCRLDIRTECDNGTDLRQRGDRITNPLLFHPVKSSTGPASFSPGVNAPDFLRALRP